MLKLEKNIQSLLIAKMICRWMCVLCAMSVLSNLLRDGKILDVLIQVVARNSFWNLIGFYLGYKVIDSIIEIIEELKTTV